MDKCKTGLGYNVVPPPYTGNFMPPNPNLVYLSLDDFVDVNKSVNESVVENPTVKSNEPKTASKENGAPTIKDWVFESEEDDEPKPKVNTARPKAVLTAIQGNHVIDVKASACWVWRPKHKFLDHVSRKNGASMSFKRFDYVKNINREAQLHAKVDGKKVVISEALAGEIFSLEIKKNLDSATKILMFPRFVQVFLNNQLEEMANNTRIYVPPSHTKKIFGNMKRVGKGFSRRDTPLFPTMMVQAQEELGEDISIPIETYPTPIITKPTSSQPLKKQKPRKTMRQDTELPQTSVPTEAVADEAINEEMYDHLERATTIAIGLDAKQDRGNISKTQSKATPNEPSTLGTIQVVVPSAKTPWGILLLRLEKSQEARKEKKSRSHRMKRLYKVGLSARVESSADEESLGEGDSSKQGRISDIDANQDIYLVNVHRDEDILGVNDQDNTLMFDVDKDLQGEEVNAATTTTATPTIYLDEITLAKALIEIKTSRPKAKGLVMQDPSETPTPSPIVSSQQPSKVQDKGKGIMVEELLKMKKKDQILFDEEVARKLQEEIYEKERLIG
nr:hypothetical protein [Tanacetum cinerariifolium]